MIRIATTICLIATLSALPTGLPCQDPGGGGPKGTSKQDKVKPEPVAVVQVNDEFRIVLKSELTPLKKQLADEYKAAVASWNLAKKEAAKAKAKFDQKRPKKPVLKLHGQFKSREEADKKVAELRETAEEKRRAELEKAEKKDRPKTDKAKGKSGKDPLPPKKGRGRG